MIGWEQVKSLIDGVTGYYSIQLGRCAVFSVLILGLVLLLRKTILKDCVFMKGALWGLFLIVPFLGKLRLYYENALARKAFLWWQDLCIGFVFVRYGYFLGVLIAVICLVRKHWRMQKMLAAMPVESINRQRMYICNAPMSPFTTGLFRHRIIIPRVMREKMSDRELATIQLHEKTHIRLGHLWVFFLWDILCTLLWCNPLLRYSSRYLKDDMEHICDTVTIQKNGNDNTSYGKLIIKSMTLLSVESASLATFSGEDDYSDIKNRMKRIRAYTPYNKSRTLSLVTACTACIVCLLMIVNRLSYPVYTANAAISVIDADGNVTMFGDSPVLKQAFRYDESYVYIDNKIFCELLGRQGVQASDLYLVFGSYEKLPGVGGGGNTVHITSQHLAEDYIEIPYHTVKKDISGVLKWL